MFENNFAKSSFWRHVSRAGALVRIAIYAGYFLKLVFGSRLKLIPIVGALDGPLSALLAMHNAKSPSHDYSNTQSQVERCNFVEQENYDLIVAGSGPGGAITAAMAQGTVLVIEEGSRLDHTIPHHSAAQMEQFFAFGGQEIILSIPPIPFAQGKAWGGGSEINSGLYHRLPESIKTKWMEATGLTIENWNKSEAEVEDALKVEQQSDKDLGPYLNSPIKLMGEQLKWRGGVIPRWRKYDKQKFEHFGMSDTYLKSAEVAKNSFLTGHAVYKLSQSKEGVTANIKGRNCKHKVSGKKICLAAGTISTPQILINSKLAKASDFQFKFHMMAREVAEYPFQVNDLADIDPHQIWSQDEKYKIGAAVATGELLEATAASKGIKKLGDLRKIAVYYISAISDGKSGLINIFGNLLPYYFPTASKRKELDSMVSLLRNSIIGSGGQPIGNSKASTSTVHVFGSMSIGECKLVSSKGVLIGSGGKVFVRDASILPSHTFVNPQGPLMHLITSLERDRNSEA